MKKFWDDGLQFECQGSGKCCTTRGSYGYVYLTLEDRKRFANGLDLSLKEFTSQYCDVTEGHYHLKGPEKDCEFLEGKRCSVYELRPVQCRTWPFWPENMNAKTWTEIKSFCPGVGQGKTRSAQEIEAQLKEAEADTSA